MNVSGPEHLKVQLANRCLAEDNARLRKLIAKAEDSGLAVAHEPESCCPWCEGQTAWNGTVHVMRHDPDCEAFSAPGVVR